MKLRHNVSRLGVALVIAFVVCLGLAARALNGMTASLSRSAAATSSTPAWVDISPPQVSIDPNNPVDNYGYASIKADPLHHNILYTGTNYQGLWKSTNSGASWFKVNTGPGGNLLDTGRQWTLDIDPFNTQNIYTTAGYGANGVLKSTDGGVSWTDVFAPASGLVGTDFIANITVDPFTPNHLLVSFHSPWSGGQDPGIVESKDGGNTWIVHNSTGNWNWGPHISFGDNSNTWLLGSDTSGVWQTANGGASWQQVWTGNLDHGKGPIYRNPSSGALFMTTGVSAIKSTDNGATWQDITGGLPYAYYSTVIGDGTNLFTAPNFPVLGTYVTGPWYTRPENGSSGWVPYSAQTTCNSLYCNGPGMMDLDPVNHIIYSANLDAGIWKLDESGTPPPTPTPTVPPTATPTPPPTPTPTAPPTPTPTATPTPGPGTPLNNTPCSLRINGVLQEGTCSGTMIVNSGLSS